LNASEDDKARKSNKVEEIEYFMVNVICFLVKRLDPVGEEKDGKKKR